MKDIDLLPEWHKSGRRKQVGLRGQYIALCGVIAVMAAWSFFNGRAVSSAQAGLSQQQPQRIKAEATLTQVKQLESKIQQLRKKTYLIEEIDSGLDIPNVISELSFLLGKNLVLNEVSFEAEKFENAQRKRKPVSGIRIARSGSAKNNASPLGKVLFKVIIKGIAAETSDVGELVRKLEQSEYFCSVSLSFSRNRKISIKTADAKQDKQVSEFEINCYLANYQLQGQS